MRVVERNRFAQIVVALLFLAPLASLQSQDGIAWESVAGAPESAPGVELIIADSRGGLYALNPRGVFFSDDRGDSWENVIEPIEFSIEEMALTTDDRLLIGTTRGLYVFAPDGGLIPLGREVFESSTILDIKVFGVDEMFVVAQHDPGEGRVYLSRDGGASWDVWEEWGDRTGAVEFLRTGVFNFVRNQTQILRTTDNGLYWGRTHFASDVDVEKIYSVSTGSDSTLLYTWINAAKAWQDGFYRLDVTANRWHQIYRPHPERILAATIRGSSEIYLAVTNGIFRSTDFGESWDTLLVAAVHRPLESVEHLFLYGDSLYVGMSSELVRIDLQSGRIDHLSRGFGPGNVTSMTWLADRTLLVTVGDRLYRSSDDGELRWIEVKPGVAAGFDIGLGEYIVTEGYNGGALLYARPRYRDTAHWGRLLWSGNGKEWRTIDSGLTDYRFHLPIVLDDRSLVVEGPYFFGPDNLSFSAYEYARSSDGGRTWHDLGSLTSSNRRPAVLSGNGQFLLKSENRGVLQRNLGGGGEWENIADSSDGDTTSNSFDHHGLFRNGVAVARRADTLLVSRDSGVSWHRMSTLVDRDLPLYYLYDSARLLLGTQTDSLLYSSDYGETWQPLNSNGVPPGLMVLDIFTLPDDGVYMTVESPLGRRVPNIYRMVRGSDSSVEELLPRYPSVLLLE